MVIKIKALEENRKCIFYEFVFVRRHRNVHEESEEKKLIKFLLDIES